MGATSTLRSRLVCRWPPCSAFRCTSWGKPSGQWARPIRGCGPSGRAALGALSNRWDTKGGPRIIQSLGHHAWEVRTFEWAVKADVFNDQGRHHEASVAYSRAWEASRRAGIKWCCKALTELPGMPWPWYQLNYPTAAFLHLSISGLGEGGGGKLVKVEILDALDAALAHHNAHAHRAAPLSAPAMVDRRHWHSIFNRPCRIEYTQWPSVTRTDALKELFKEGFGLESGPSGKDSPPRPPHCPVHLMSPRSGVAVCLGRPTQPFTVGGADAATHLPPPRARSSPWHLRQPTEETTRVPPAASSDRRGSCGVPAARTGGSTMRALSACLGSTQRH